MNLYTLFIYGCYTISYIRRNKNKYDLLFFGLGVIQSPKTPKVYKIQTPVYIHTHAYNILSYRIILYDADLLDLQEL